MEGSLINISVIMPVYNSAHFLKEAIDSVLNQTYKDYEFLIINDGSTDHSESIILSYNDTRIKYHKNEFNKGLVYTLNKGLQLAKGKYIARMDADDICLPTRFEKQFLFLENNKDIAVVAALIKQIDNNNSDLGFWNDDFNKIAEGDIKAFMPKLNCIAHPSVMMRADVVKKIGYKLYKNAEDWGLWLTLLSNGFRIVKLNEVLLYYRIHPSSLSNNNSNNTFNRIIIFKINYIKNKLIHLQFKKYDIKVVEFLFKDILKYKLPWFFALFVKYKETHLLELIKQYKALKQLFSEPFRHHVIFFFPFYHIGGAEIVHSEIVSASKHKKPLVLITNHSSSSYILEKFKNDAEVLKIEQLLVWPFLRNWFTKKLVTQLQHHPEIILFSSNSKFYYSLLKSIPTHTQAIDLIHAFMHKHEPNSNENWSLPVINQLTKRVIINNQTRKDFETLYHTHKISSEFLKRITYIPNYVDHQAQRIIDVSTDISVLYVGRGTSEKRVPLIAHIAKEISVIDTSIKFHFVGDVASVIPKEYLPFCILHGEVSDRKKLSDIYNQCHILILASEREGFPLVIMEAMMHSLVTITTNVGGISDHVNDLNGVLIDATEYTDLLNSFINAINQIKQNPSQLKNRSSNAYHYAQKHFNKEQFYNSYHQLFLS